jgi:hypothetical protein
LVFSPSTVRSPTASVPVDIGAIPYDPGHYAIYCAATLTGSDGGCTPSISASGTSSLTSGLSLSGRGPFGALDAE